MLQCKQGARARGGINSVEFYDFMIVNRVGTFCSPEPEQDRGGGFDVEPEIANEPEVVDAEGLFLNKLPPTLLFNNPGSSLTSPGSMTSPGLLDSTGFLLRTPCSYVASSGSSVDSPGSSV